MKYSSNDLAKALYLAARGRNDKDAGEMIRSFVERTHRRLGVRQLRKVLDALPGVAKRIDGIEDVTVETARKLPDRAVKEALSALGIDPDRSEVTTRIDPDLIGGVRIKRPDRVLDATVKSKLARLRAAAKGRTTI